MIQIPKFSDLKILVIGDVFLDHFCHGKASRLSPDAPIPIVKSDSEFYTPGGAANVARNLSEIGCKVSLIGYIGNDAEGHILRSLLIQNRVDIQHSMSCGNTIVKRRIIANDQHIVRYDREIPFTEQCINTDLIHQIPRLKEFDAIILSDYNKGTISQELCNRIKNDFKGPIFADIKPAHKDWYKSIYCITPNYVEASAMYPDVACTRKLISVVKEDLALQCVLFTMSEKGIMLLDDHDNIHEYPVHTIKRERHYRIDVTGAGDTVISWFACCVASGMSVRDACFISNVAAAIVVNKIGTATCSVSEVNQELLGIVDLI